MSLTIQRATASDALKIHHLAEAIWWKHYPAIIGEEQVTYMLNKMYALSTLEEQISNGIQEYFIILENEIAIGFFAVEIQENKEAFIHKFYILQTEQRKGIGANSFQLLLNQFPQINCIRLQVNRQNYQAINFYFKMQFKIEKVADFNIGNDYFMNDFIMIWQRKTME